MFGFNHAHVGGLLANRWKLAATVQAAVMYHHSPATNRDDCRSHYGMISGIN